MQYKKTLNDTFPKDEDEEDQVDRQFYSLKKIFASIKTVQLFYEINWLKVVFSKHLDIF